ncbi:trehalose-phosphatase [Roseibium sp.]|uniref:trehalose-phosphatase n=1 Tax=Roseibium sp. TaxID=1936156 RepID=UPI003A97B9AC
MIDAPLLEPNMALFLDFDGTLAELAARPGDVSVGPDVISTLRRLQGELGGALAVVSGRPIDQLDEFLAPLQLPAAGLHGLEHRETLGSDIIKAGETDEIQTLKKRTLASGLLERGVFFEDKGPTLALHYRSHPELEGDLAKFVEEALQDLPLLHKVSGKMVIEAKPDASDKGVALRHFMEHPPFAGRRPVFVGDDVTDEDGIAAAQTLGGFGIKVGDSASCARYRLKDVTAVLAWLAGKSLIGI